MPRKPDLPCADCGKMLWRRTGVSLPRGQARCNVCRKARPVGAWNEARARGRTVPIEEQIRRMVEARQASARLKACESCPVEFVTSAPNKRYCDSCQDARRRDHYRKKNRSRLGYQKSIRSFPLTALGDRDAWTCWLCQDPVDKALKSRNPLMASYDHVIPTSKGGSDEPDNLRLAHLRCNIARGNREMETTG